MTIATFLGPRVVADTTAIMPLVEPETPGRHMVGAAEVAHALGQDRARVYLQAEEARFAQLGARLGEARTLARAPLAVDDPGDDPGEQRRRAHLHRVVLRHVPHPRRRARARRLHRRLPHVGRPERRRLRRLAVAAPRLLRGRHRRREGRAGAGASSPTTKATFATNAIGCAPSTPTSTCTGGSCYPTTAHPCVYAAGSASCPSGFPHQTLVYSSLTDNYACTQCTCTAANVTCKPTLELYGNASCSGATSIMSLTLDGTCTHYGVGANGAVVIDPGTPSGGSCAATGGGTLTGSASFNSPTTVCCQ